MPHSCMPHSWKPRLAIYAVLLAIEDRVVCLLAFVCSSFSSMNLGTSKRSPCNPAGDTNVQSVHDGNCMLSRTLPCLISHVPAKP